MFIYCQQLLMTSYPLVLFSDSRARGRTWHWVCHHTGWVLGWGR